MWPTILSKYYNENREWIVFVSKWFLFAAVLGGIAFFLKPDLINSILGVFQDKFGDQPAVHNANFAKEIFIQNSIACLIALVGGLVFGITSFLIVFFNGFIIGFVILLLVTLPGNPLHNIEYVFLGLVPHGLFELPAFILASALGLRLGTEWLRATSQGHRWGIIKANALRVVQSVPVLTLLLLIAAFVEVFVSGQLVDNFK